MLCRLSASHYEEALIAQGAIPILLRLIQVQGHADLQGRIRSKAAISLANIAATGYGIKALEKQSARHVISTVSESSTAQNGPVHLICKSLLSKLSTDAQLITLV